MVPAMMHIKRQPPRPFSCTSIPRCAPRPTWLSHPHGPARGEAEARGGGGLDGNAGCDEDWRVTAGAPNVYDPLTHGA